jgi:hypothetical protein
MFLERYREVINFNQNTYVPSGILIGFVATGRLRKS